MYSVLSFVSFFSPVPSPLSPSREGTMFMLIPLDDRLFSHSLPASVLARPSLPRRINIFTVDRTNTHGRATEGPRAVFETCFEAWVERCKKKYVYSCSYQQVLA